MKRLKSILIAAVLTVIGVSTASAQGPRKFYGFGDSLADNGNVLLATQALGFNPAIPPSMSPHRTYSSAPEGVPVFGRFSNGAIAFEYLWVGLTGGNRGFMQPFLLSPNLDADAVSFAFGGSGTDFITQSPGGFPVIGLKGQVALFGGALGGRRASSEDLFGIISGANDYLRLIGGDQPADPNKVVGDISQSILALYLLGARNVIVLNLPNNLGNIPLVARLNPNPMATSARLNGLAAGHNALLATRLNQLERLLGGLNVIAIDVNAVPVPMGIDLDTPALDVEAIGGLNPLASICLFVNTAACTDAEPTAFDNPLLPFFFWDAEHPTTGVHLGLAQYILGQLMN
jgi:phospholipase/lecithinase/hemolysin